jgi:hypothetical protein
VNDSDDLLKALAAMGCGALIAIAMVFAGLELLL